MAKDMKKSSTKILARDAAKGRFVVRRGDGTVETVKVSPRSKASIRKAARRYERVLERLADK